MPGQFLRPIDLSAPSLLLVALYVIARLYERHRDNSAARWLMGYLTAVIGMTLVWLLASTRLDAWQYYALHLREVAWTAGMICLIQYSYRVGDYQRGSREARLALTASLITGAAALGWAGYQIAGLAEGRGSLNTLPVVLINVLGYGWGFVTLLRQARRIRQGKRGGSAIRRLVLLIFGSSLLVVAGLISLYGLLSGKLAAIGFTRVFLLLLGIHLIGFNFLFYSEPLSARITRVTGAALLMLQTTFAFIGLLYTRQFELGAHTVTASLIDLYSAPDAPQIALRMELDIWTQPIFGFQVVIVLVAIVLLTFAGSRIQNPNELLMQTLLSTRQRDIVYLVAEGYINSEIAEQLLVSENTVKYHLKIIYHSLKLPSREALVQWMSET